MRKYFTLGPLLEDLDNAWVRCADSDSRFAFYEYLELIYRFYADLQKEGQERWAVKQLSERISELPLYEKDLVRMLIDASCDADRKTKSRWARALRYVRSRQVNWRHCARFLKENGGPAGCAKKETQRRPERRRAEHYGGPDFKYLSPIQLRRYRVSIAASAHKRLNSFG